MKGHAPQPLKHTTRNKGCSAAVSSIYHLRIVTEMNMEITLRSPKDGDTDVHLDMKSCELKYAKGFAILSEDLGKLQVLTDRSNYSTYINIYNGSMSHWFGNKHDPTANRKPMHKVKTKDKEQNTEFLVLHYRCFWIFCCLGKLQAFAP